VRRFIPQLEGAPGVEHVAFFGALLHVSGYDRNLLSAALAPLKNISGLEISETAPSLEDVFIDLQRPRRQAA
jgi:ABC-2 type transport system ATP-binding protein